MSDIEAEQNHTSDSKEFEQQGKSFDPRVLNQINKAISQVESFLDFLNLVGGKLTSVQSDLHNLRSQQKKDNNVVPVKKEVKKSVPIVYEMDMFTEELLALFNMEKRKYGIEEKELELRMKSDMTDNQILRSDLEDRYYTVFNVTDKEREIHRAALGSNLKVCVNTSDFNSLIKRVLVKNTTIKFGDKVVNLRHYLNNTSVDVISNELVKQNLASIQHNDIVLNDEVFQALNELNRTTGRQLEESKISLAKFNRFLASSKDHDDIYVEVDSSIEVPDDLFVEVEGKRYAKHHDYAKFLKRKTQANKSQ